MTPEERALGIIEFTIWGSGLVDPGGKPTTDKTYLLKAIAHEIREAVLEEREACAKVADDEAREHEHVIDQLRCFAIAREIRSRGQPTT